MDAIVQCQGDEGRDPTATWRAAMVWDDLMFRYFLPAGVMAVRRS